MFKTAHNMMKLKVKITPQTPVLVASGKTFEVTHPDIEFIRVNTQEGETIYLPGSSIKGVLRAGMEAVLGENEKFADKICITSEKMCHELHKDKRDTRNKVPYKFHCPVCRMFGSGELASRVEISDIFPFDLDDSPEEKKERIKTINQMITSRTGIQIDRKTGKTKGGALFNYEILGGGELFGDFTFTNYELYQPGLLFTLFDLSNEGFLRYGHSKSRGLGVLNFTLQSIKILQLGELKGKSIKGIGIIKKHSDYDFYMKENDRIEREFNGYYENQFLYSTLTFANKEIIDEVTALFKSKISTFLE
jgi:CRISPR/Cas system CSM-associated protein Csm3 (group 7 of RAMP superfamily)